MHTDRTWSARRPAIVSRNALVPKLPRGNGSNAAATHPQRQPWSIRGSYVLLTMILISVAFRLLPTIFSAPANDRLIVAASADDEEQFAAALRDGASARYRDAIGATALMHAAVCGNISMARRLVNRGADANARNCWGQTPLTLAASSNKAHIVRLLIESGADPSLHDQSGHPVLDLCYECNATDAAEVLCSWGDRPACIRNARPATAGGTRNAIVPAR